MKLKNCHCEGAVGDCGNLPPLALMRTVHFLRRRPKADAAIFRQRRTQTLETAKAPKGPRNDVHSFNLDKAIAPPLILIFTA